MTHTNTKSPSGSNATHTAADEMANQGTTLRHWTGPFGAVHALALDFWERNHAAVCDSLAPHHPTDNDYVRYKGFGKIEKVHESLVPEFSRFVDESDGADHTHDDRNIFYDTIIHDTQVTHTH